MLQAIKYSEAEGLDILDQLLLPQQSVFIKVKNIDDGFKAIRTMQVRGAPAIAIVGMLSLAEELKSLKFESSGELIQRMNHRLTYLLTARPTAVNLSNACTQIRQLAQENLQLDVIELKNKLITFAVDMLENDITDNRAIGKHGAEAIKGLNGEKQVNVLTHCNTGSLATAGYGTALGVVRALHDGGSLEHAYCTETRPYNQGCRLTAYELVHDKIPATLICDSMISLLMGKRGISAVVVGADRVAANGDTANKIGTQQIAIIAKHFNVSFYIAAPFTSVDFNLPSGDMIPIEERPAEEMACVNGMRIAATGINCWNPAFDVTPADLITGIITERGVIKPCDLISHK